MMAYYFAQDLPGDPSLARARAFSIVFRPFFLNLVPLSLAASGLTEGSFHLFARARAIPFPKV